MTKSDYADDFRGYTLERQIGKGSRVARHAAQGCKACILKVGLSPCLRVNSMPTANIIRICDAIRTTLQHRAARLPDAKAISEATGVTWRLVEALLVPVIGARGLDVLFRRALQQTSFAFPWIAAAADPGGSLGPLPSLMASLAAQDSATGAEATSALLMSFVESLATLLGDSLTERLLAPLWEQPSLPTEQQTAS
jgi:hypothetical protein